MIVSKSIFCCIPHGNVLVQRRRQRSPCRIELRGILHLHEDVFHAHVLDMVLQPCAQICRAATKQNHANLHLRLRCLLSSTPATLGCSRSWVVAREAAAGALNRRCCIGCSIVTSVICPSCVCTESHHTRIASASTAFCSAVFPGHAKLLANRHLLVSSAATAEHALTSLLNAWRRVHPSKGCGVAYGTIGQHRLRPSIPPTKANQPALANWDA
mmetsp:Transcript_11792/g.21473  ORF Transcript_11792/g.21473 Transcript_11792/m.21473 type:complete len:214 (-) Transcript_11792:231-872(-)